MENDSFVSTQKIDFTVDERKERLSPSRDKNEGRKHRRRKVDEKFCVTPAGTSTSLTSRINGNTTHTQGGGVGAGCWTARTTGGSDGNPF